MADDDDDDEDGDEGEEGEEGEGEGDSEVRTPAAEGSIKPEDTEMTDSVPEVVTQLAEQTDVEMKDDDTPSKSTAAPPNPLTLAPPLASLASGSPKVEGSPLKNVVLPSPTAEVPPPLLEHSPLIPSQPDEAVATESLVAEPPSTIVGEEPTAAVERDIPRAASSTEEALLPPPPDQVGNISSPKAESASERPTEGDEKAKDSQTGDELGPQRPPLVGYDSVMTEDSIKPDDSASTHIVSGAPSEIDTSSAVDAPAAPKTASPIAEAKGPSPPMEAATEGQADLLGGLMGELDRHASVKPEASKEATPGEATPVAEPEPAEKAASSEPKAPSQEPQAAEPLSPKREPVPGEPAAVEPAAVQETEVVAQEPEPAPEPAVSEPPATDAKEEPSAQPGPSDEPVVAEAPVPSEPAAEAPSEQQKDESPAVKEEKE
jgi:hypothetical protein